MFWYMVLVFESTISGSALNYGCEGRWEASMKLGKESMFSDP
jgi:hypothetical protein